MDGWTDRELLAAFARGDEAAFSAFYARHAHAVHARLVPLVSAEPDVEEAMQDVFLLAAAKWRSIPYVDGSARGWLMGTARNVGFNRARSARRRGEAAGLPAPEPMADAHTQLELRLEVGRVEQAVRQMDSLDQSIYRAAFIDGRSHAETARMLGLEAAAVRQRFARIRRHLASRLRGGSDD